MKEKVLEYIEETYGAKPEYLWVSTPANAALRNPRNGKWFGVLLGQLPLCKLGVKTDGKADVLNLKCDPVMSFAVVDNERIFPGYHMNKEHWISVVMDGSVSLDEIKILLDMSYEMVDCKGKGKIPAKHQS